MDAISSDNPRVFAVKAVEPAQASASVASKPVTKADSNKITAGVHLLSLMDEPGQQEQVPQAPALTRAAATRFLAPVRGQRIQSKADEEHLQLQQAHSEPVDPVRLLEVVSRAALPSIRELHGTARHHTSNDEDADEELDEFVLVDKHTQ